MTLESTEKRGPSTPSLEEWAARIAAEAPELTEAQAEKIARHLRPAAGTVRVMSPPIALEAA